MNNKIMKKLLAAELPSRRAKAEMKPRRKLAPWDIESNSRWADA